MAFTSASFVGFVMAVVLLHSLMKTTLQRSLVSLGANLVFIASYVEDVGQLAPLAAFLLLGYLGMEACRRTRSSGAMWSFVLLVIAAFVFLKKYSFLGDALQLPFPYLLIGLSYVLFRMLHLMVDAKQGELVQTMTPLQFFNYCCNFLTFVAGPIQRYADHARQLAAPPSLDEGRVFAAFARMVKGFVKVGVVSAVFKYLFDMASTRLLDPELAAALAGPAALGLFIAAAVFYTVYLYANFAGYMDIVIGIGELMGLQLPENFNQPFLARSFLDFWSRWHMTLSDWFKTYLFNPLLTWMAVRFTSPAAGPYLGVVAFFITFLVMGVWHGSTSVFVIYGLLMGAGASINKLWQVMAVKRLGKKRYKALAEKTTSVYLARGMTLAYFAMALTCLWVDLPQLAGLWQKLGLVGLLACYIGLSLMAAAAFFVCDRAGAALLPVRLRAGGVASGPVARNFGLAVQVLLIFTVSSFFHKAPEFVYRAF